MEYLKIFITIMLAMLTTFAVVNTIVSEWSNRGFILDIWKRFTLRMFAEVFSVLIIVIVVGFTCYFTLPFLRFGWLSLFVEGGGNIAIAPIMEGAKYSFQLIRILPPIFLFFLLVALPFFAKAEEEAFRHGYEDWRGIVIQSIKFGLIHLLVGIPIYAFIPLSIAGFFFGYKYKRAFEKSRNKGTDVYCSREEGVLASTAYHTLYNSILILFLLIVCIAMV
ncbi:MAG: CPBP family glutamic-type intramembrane protease [Candidatus Nomurabacteria bacterium]|nr:CPBP family glutamic-type intramembrane protease [Candidatus Nomurabacteria bacterium]